jgi:hypothetical protein
LPLYKILEEFKPNGEKRMATFTENFWKLSYPFVRMAQMMKLNAAKLRKKAP